MGPVFFAGILIIVPLALSAQRQASLGIGTGIVRYSGGSSFSLLTLAPAAQRITPASYTGIGGGLSLLDAGGWAAQGRADLWAWLSHHTSGTRVGVSSTLAASARTDGVGAGSGAALLELVTTNAAIGAGAVTGVIEGEPGVGALRLRARGWRPFVAGSQL